MMILTIRTDNPVAEIGLFENDHRLHYCKWQADRELAETLHQKIYGLLNKSNVLLEHIQGIVVFGGPGSFTGLRIGITVANSLAFGLKVPVIGTSGDAWIGDGLAAILAGNNDKTVIPEYGRPPNVTNPKK